MELRRKIDGFPCHYFVIGILVCICTSMLRVFVYSFGEGQTMAVQNVSEILSVCLNEGIYLLGISLIIINEYRLQYRDESLMKSEYIGMLKEYHRMQDRHMKEVHKIRHDMKNHMMIVGEYLEQEKWDEAKAYLAQMEDVASWERKQLIDVGNDVVSAVFSMEREQAGDEIVFQCEGHVSEKVAISDYDLCTIFSNLLSNAREACERLQRKEKRIEILLKEYQKQMLVTIKNPIEWEVDIEKLGTYTSKEDGEVHGYGISNVMEAVARYDGEIWFDVRDGMFTVSVKI